MAALSLIHIYKYNYYYVPSYFIGDTKLFEGHAEKADVEKVFKAALEA